MKYSAIFQPLSVGPLTWRNRIEVAPAAPFLSWREPDGRMPLKAYYQKLAASGAAVVTLGIGSLEDDPRNPGMVRPACCLMPLDELPDLAATLKKDGCLASVELTVSRYMMGPRDRITSMPESEVKAIISAYAFQARRAMEAGFDMILIHGGHGNVPAQFFAPYINKRTDAYGGSPEKRSRFALELLDAVRDAVGGKLAIEYRISANEVLPGTTTLEETLDFAERIQVVPSYADWISWRLMAWCILHRKPWVASLERSRNGWKGWPVRKVFATLADKFARKVFCIGTLALEQFAKLGVRREKLAWTAYAMPRVQADDVAVEHDGEAGVRFAFVGALTERKAVDVLAEAFRTVRSSYPRATLKVVGDGPLRSVFNGIGGVTMVGAVAPDQVNRAIAGCGVIVLPSRYDSWGVALAEGACLGMAMIATSGVGAAEIIRESGEGANGIVVPPGDVDALAEAMRRYAGNPTLVTVHGRNARAAAAALDADALAEHVESELRG